jgi:hypothetical protein
VYKHKQSKQTSELCTGKRNAPSGDARMYLALRNSRHQVLA